MKQLVYAVGIILLGASITIAQSADQQKKSSDQKRDPKAGAPASGHSGPRMVEKPTSTSGSAGQATPAIQSEAGKAQAPGKSPDVPPTAPDDVKANQSTAMPRSPIQAGQAVDEAERGAQAAARAEIRPGATLGVGATIPQDTQAKSQETAQSNKTGKKSKPAQKAKQP